MQVLHPLLLCPHVNSPRQTGLSVRTRATRRLDWGPSTSLRSSDPPVSLVNGHVRRLHQQPGFNYKTDSAHCASSSAFSSKVDHVHCTFSSASNQPPLPSIKKGPPFTSTSPTWQRSEDAGAVPEAIAAKSKLTGLLLHLPPRPRAVPQRGPRQLTSSTTPSTGKRTSTSSQITSVIPCAVLC